MLKTTLLSLGLLAITFSSALANPATIPIDKAFKHTQKLEVSDVDHLLDFTDTRYRVIKAFPSNPQQLRALSLSRNDHQQLLLKWTPNGTAKKASVFLRVMGPGGEQTITLLVKRSGNEPDNIRTAFVPSQTVSKDAVIGEVAEIPPKPTVAPIPNQLIRPNWKSHNSPKTAQPVKAPLTLTHPKSPPVLKLRATPKPIPRIAKVTTTGRPLIDRTTLDNKALANYLLRGLHRARGLRQINRHHDNYWFAQSMARYLKRGVSVDKALRWSRLPEKTFNDLLGHGGVSR
ncbi:hypothetical protein [Acaryochloris marina]|uniref:AMIN domain-containing protein n=1 Tax=Acaryochloris marina (strain MBIC 11017) TaxID=329726 RepID=A8ZR07_ACAM1|nr:hypothetical protein [Acaryochloris marina]ABW33443.1 hypothetical protein AM1_H0093 [Acaryochloris marina MBIC11017]